MLHLAILGVFINSRCRRCFIFLWWGGKVSEVIGIRAKQITVSSGFDGGVVIAAAMTVDQMNDVVRNIAAKLPGDEWKKIMAEINEEWQNYHEPVKEICHNCGAALPEGCGGLFRKDGNECLLSRER